MRNQPRDVTGGEQVWGEMIPGLGLLNYVLALLTVPIEVFLRRDFGERWFTRMNFIGGLIIMILWNALGGLFRMLGAFNPVGMIFGRGGNSEPGSWMGLIIILYILFGIAHFLTIWWKDITDKSVHSFSAGRSWLSFVGQAVMFFLNLILNNIVRLVFFVTRSDKKQLPSYLPVLRDVNTFTERFIEPAFVLYLASKAFAAGQGTVGWWLIFSVMALNLYTGMRHQAERGAFLDYRDQWIDANAIGRSNRSGRVTNANERLVQRTAREVEKHPEILPIIRDKNPSLARAIERISPKLKAIAEREQGPGGQQTQVA